jgi:hypothetical protein
MASIERVLEKVEELTTERYGRGAAVSVDEEDKKFFVRCWNARGVVVNEVSRTLRTTAIEAMLYDLKLAKAKGSADE